MIHYLVGTERYMFLLLDEWGVSFASETKMHTRLVQDNLVDEHGAFSFLLKEES